MRVDQLSAMQRRQYPQLSDGRYADVVRNFNVLPDQKIAQLSRGERAGVNLALALALALAQAPELLILDEPTLGLDVVAKRAFLEALMFTNMNDESTIVFCSHQMEEIERIADNLIISSAAPCATCRRPASVALPGPFSDLDRVDIARLLDGTLLSFNSGRHMVLGEGGAARPAGVRHRPLNFACRSPIPYG